jgi:hypothetical protein
MKKNCPPSASSVLRRSRVPAARNSCRAPATDPPVVPLPRVARSSLAPPLMRARHFRTLDCHFELSRTSPLNIDFPPWVLRSSFFTIKPLDLADDYEHLQELGELLELQIIYFSLHLQTSQALKASTWSH